MAGYGRIVISQFGGPEALDLVEDELRDHPEWFREDLTALFDLLAKGKIHPVIMERIPWREARRAQEILDQGAIQGKLVLTFS